MSLFNALNYLYPNAVVGADYILRNDGDGDYIADWHLSTPQPTQDDLSAAEAIADEKITIKNTIAELESTITERRYREAILGIDNGWLKNINDQIAALRSKL